MKESLQNFSQNSAPKISGRELNKPKQKLSPEEFMPRRFGLSFNPPMIVLEYMIKSRGKLYQKKFKLFKLQASTPTETALQYLKLRYCDFFRLGKIKDQQFLSLIGRLKQGLGREAKKVQVKETPSKETETLDAVDIGQNEQPEEEEETPFYQLPAKREIKRNNLTDRAEEDCLDPSEPGAVDGLVDKLMEGRKRPIPLKQRVPKPVESLKPLDDSFEDYQSMKGVSKEDIDQIGEVVPIKKDTDHDKEEQAYSEDSGKEGENEEEPTIEEEKTDNSPALFPNPEKEPSKINDHTPEKAAQSDDSFEDIEDDEDDGFEDIDLEDDGFEAVEADGEEEEDDDDEAVIKGILERERAILSSMGSEATLDKINLNKLNDREVIAVKNKMEVGFSQNSLQPGDEGFEYDKEKEFEGEESNEWDKSIGRNKQIIGQPKEKESPKIEEEIDDMEDDEDLQYQEPMDPLESSEPHHRPAASPLADEEFDIDFDDDFNDDLDDL